MLYLLLLISTVFLTSIFSYLIFQRFIDNQMNVIDIDTTVIRIKLEKLYERKINLFELPDYTTRERANNNSKNSSVFLEKIEKDYPDYKFMIKTLEGTIEYKEEPKLIYDNRESKYYFEISREIHFAENIPFKSIKLSLKLNFFQMILKSLLYGTIITVIILIPLILFFSRTIITPIIRISRGARQIAGGNLGIQVKTKAKDELGELAKSFNYMSKELHKMKRIRDDLLAMISHELRSPLGRIQGYTEILNDLELSKKDKESYRMSIFSEVNILNKMVGEIIEISRLELKKETMYFEKIDLGNLIEEVKRELSLRKNVGNDVKYKITYHKHLLVKIDVDKMKRVLLNVIENSIKANATEISLSAKKDEKKIYIKIIDNGIGIPEDLLEIVFEKFYRVDKSRDRKTGGFGLGLSICKGIIEEHNGKIYFTKRKKGTELNIELSLETQ